MHRWAIDASLPGRWVHLPILIIDTAVHTGVTHKTCPDVYETTTFLGRLLKLVVRNRDIV
jgi:hypothetical protein